MYQSCTCWCHEWTIQFNQNSWNNVKIKNNLWSAITDTISKSEPYLFLTYRGPQPIKREWDQGMWQCLEVWIVQSLSCQKYRKHRWQTKWRLGNTKGWARPWCKMPVVPAVMADQTQVWVLVALYRSVASIQQAPQSKWRSTWRRIAHSLAAGFWLLSVEEE